MTVIVNEPADDVSSPASALQSDVQWEVLSDESVREEDYAPAAAADDDLGGETGEPREPSPAEPLSEESPAPATPTEGAQDLQVQPEQTPQAPPPPPPQLTPEQQAEQQRQWQVYQQRQVAQLEQYYALQEDDAVALATEPEKVLPKLAARLHLEVMQNVQQQIASQMPQMVQTVQASSQREEQAKGEFFTVWPDLRGHEPQIIQAGMLYRQMNPMASPQQAIDGIGRIVTAALGKQTVSPQPSQAAPAARAPAFRPASGAGGSAPAAKQKSVWSDLAEDD